MRIVKCARAGRSARASRRVDRPAFFWGALVSIGMFLILFMASPVRAEIIGTCAASVNGIDVAPRSSTSPNDAIPLAEHTSVSAAGSSATQTTNVRVHMEMAGFRWTVSDQANVGTSWRSSSISVDKYAKYGVGLYKVVAETSGGVPCVAAVLVKVEGNPLGTAAGIGGAAASAVGIAGVAASAGRAMYDRDLSPRRSPAPDLRGDELDHWINRRAEDAQASLKEAQAELDAAQREQRELERSRPSDKNDPKYWEYESKLSSAQGRVYEAVREVQKWEDRAERAEDEAIPTRIAVRTHVPLRLCAAAALPALLLTGAMMVSGGSSAPRPAAPVARFKPRISVLGLISGLLSGFGTLLLAQQYAVVYPTRNIAVVWIVFGVLLGGAIVPSLFRVIAIRRYNRSLGGLPPG